MLKHVFQSCNVTSVNISKNRYAMRTCICEMKCGRGKSYVNMVNDRQASETIKKAEGT